ncbi:MAG: PepSY-associated TM helix domain-containing protein [Bacteroidota bacterium]
MGPVILMGYSVKKVLGKIHLWLGLASGLIVFVIAITGSIYVFGEDIKNITHRDRRIIVPPENAEKLPISQLLVIAEDAFQNQYTYSNIVIPNFPNHTVTVMFNEYDEDKFWYPGYAKFNKTVYLNPYTGEIVKIENTKWEFFNVVFWVHITLFMGYNPISHTIVVAAVWIFVILLLTGLVLWWPNKKQRKTSFLFRWKSTTRWKRKNYDLHNILGFYFLLFALISALTGLLWASKSFNTTVKWVANGGKSIPEQELPKAKTNSPSNSPLDDILTNTLTNVPQSRYILIRKHPNEKVPYIVRSYVSESLNFTRIEMYYDRETAELLSTQEFGDKNNGDKVQALNYDIHVGTIGGWPTKILTFLMSLAVASLPITGFLIWWGRRKFPLTQKRQKGTLTQ